ncbi:MULTISPECIES: DUF2889 domain-containing protein [Mycobacterium avium complex (MAC)]|uniref:DUF2889 domain-containing protein n=4 Tax=Mycobacterium avium complex (MAC) TaxID=120793 RepID=A0AAW5S5C0_MYCBC|nr:MULTISPECIES: DUF2889 domain-containing protein [Mycobacterium avium complex (MAC)]ETA96276.1 hypothetical protein O984_00050 [Mycobacterium avium 05-4293]ETB36671.1 hypothetical protein N602_23300 [Mycobacterium avium subsp. hominissuis 10-5606]ETZ43903.1 hypothetical protein L837_4025 [Mycobacterium avium MAV_061107_1842]MBZ4502219.1 DUF2889 domain-containing protein [Mycobacterium avium subsp. hominissuis]MBZ4520549.1 DUF2889 domain-containing protein [Mycobacterium avium subsp. hominiss
MADLGSPPVGLHPLHGVHEPTTGNPPRRPRSARRTTSIDMTRDEGSLDPVYLNGRARDLWTAADGTVTELGSATLSATIELIARVVRHVEVTPPVAAMSRLAGAPAMSGFRAAVDKVAPELRQARDLRYTLLDDVPVATLISGHALSASNLLGDVAKSGYLPVADQCAGFATGGLLQTSFEAGDPVIVTGPQAPDLDHDDDPSAWHDVAQLPRHGMRRRRRIDIHEQAAGRMGVDAMFRDTYVRSDGVETIIHEYTLDAVVDAETGVIVESRATPRVLPWQECPGAVASAERITGMTLQELHFRVRRELFGTSTCTHLNDLLRSVADVEALIAT